MINLSFLERAGGHRVNMGLDIASLENDFNDLEQQSRVVALEIKNAVMPFAKPVLNVLGSVGEVVVGAVGIVGEKGAKFLRKTRIGNAIPMFTAVLPIFSLIGYSDRLESVVRDRIQNELSGKNRIPANSLTWSGDQLIIGGTGSFIQGDAPDLDMSNQIGLDSRSLSDSASLNDAASGVGEPESVNNVIPGQFFENQLGLAYASEASPLPPESSELLAKIQQEVTAAAVNSGVIPDTATIAVINIHQNAAQASFEEGRPGHERDGQIAVFTVGDEKFVATKQGPAGSSEVMIDGKPGIWHVNALTSQKILNDSGVAITQLSALGAQNSDVPLFTIETGADGIVRLNLIVPQDNGRAARKLPLAQETTGDLPGTNGDVLASFVEKGDSLGANTGGSESGEGVIVTTFNAETWAGMDKNARLEVYNNAPEIEGHEKVKSQNDRHALYRNEQTGTIDTARNLLTGEVFPIIEISMNHEKPLIITNDNLTSGLLARSEKAMCPGFSKEVIPFDWKQVRSEGFFTAVQKWNDKAEHADPRTRPQKMCSFSELTIDLGRGEMPYILIGVEVLNVDRTVGFFHKVTRVEDLSLNLANAASSYYLIMTEQLRSNDYPEKKFLMEMYPDMYELGSKMDVTDMLPEELENRIIATITSPY